jgi:hypothetical protein
VVFDKSEYFAQYVESGLETAPLGKERVLHEGMKHYPGAFLERVTADALAFLYEGMQKWQGQEHLGLSNFLELPDNIFDIKRRGLIGQIERSLNEFVSTADYGDQAMVMWDDWTDFQEREMFEIGMTEIVRTALENGPADQISFRVQALIEMLASGEINMMEASRRHIIRKITEGLQERLNAQE